MVALLGCRDAVEKSVDDNARAKQVRYLGKAWRRLMSGLVAALRHIGPGGGNEYPTAIGKNQKKLKLPLPMCLPQDLQRPPFERMGLTDDSDGFGKVFETGSVSCVPSIGSSTTP